MKILFFISLHRHGRGGHLYSLYHIANELSSIHQVGIVSIGPGDNSTISLNTNYICHINFDGVSLLGFKRKSSRVIKEFNPDVVHCFDVTSYNVIKLFYPLNRFKIALNKCGGPNRIEFPYVKNLVLFSIENKQWFESNKRYKDTNINLIPNRVSKVATSSSDIEKPEGFFSFVRIARIGKSYKKGILDSIALIDILYKKNKKLKLKLFVIGVVECQETLSEILKSKYVTNGTVVILTDDKYTKNASKMLYLADAVIGTGRGVMEATSLGLPTLTMNSLGHMPVLITKYIFDDAFKTNFSERNSFPSLDKYKNISDIEKMIVDTDFYQEISLYMNFIFKEYFDVSQAPRKYEEFYNSITDNGKAIVISDSILTLKTLYRFFKSSRKIKKV